MSAGRGSSRARSLLGGIVVLLRRPADDPLAQLGLGQGLRRRSARGAVSTAVGQWARLVMQMGATVVLARLIAPEEYGEVGMVLAIVGIGDALSNMGLSQATVQRKDLTQAHVSLFFWLQTMIGVVLTAATMLSAGLIADLYRRPALVPLTLVLAFTFLLNALSAQHQAVLSRQMRFATLALIDVLGLAVGVAVAIGLALGGVGVWALVALSLSLPVCRVVVSWYASGWSPSRPRWVPGAGGMVRFGLHLTVTNVLDYSAQNVDNVLIGRYYGAGPLGLYSRAYGLLLLPIRQVTAPLARVAVPVLSYLLDQPQRYRAFYRVAVSALAYVSLPLIAVAAALSPQVVGIMLGPDWTGAAPIFEVLALGSVLVSLRSANGWLFVSSGHTGRQAVWALVNRPVVIGGIVAGLPFGVIGVAWGFVAAHAVLFVPSFVISVKGTPVRSRDVWTAVWRPACVGVLVFVVGRSVRAWGLQSDWATVALAGALTLLSLGVLLLLWPAVRRDLAALRDAFGSRPSVEKEQGTSAVVG